MARMPQKKLGASTLDPTVTGQQGAATPQSEQNAQIQSVAGQQPREGSSGQTPAEKLLQYATAIPMPPAPAPMAKPDVDIEPAPSGMSPEEIAASLFSSGAIPATHGGYGIPGGAPGLTANTMLNVAPPGGFGMSGSFPPPSNPGADQTPPQGGYDPNAPPQEAGLLSGGMSPEQIAFKLFTPQASSFSEGPGGPEQRLPDEPGTGGTTPPPPPPPPTTHGGVPPLSVNTPEGNKPQPVTSPRGARPAAPVTPNNDWLHYDASGKAWGPDNLPPKPPELDDPMVQADAPYHAQLTARWYSQFNFLDPTLVNVTAKDVENYRTSGYNAPADVLAKTPMGNNFVAWWQNGKPMPAQTAPPPPTQTPITSNWNPSMATGGVIPDPRQMDPNDPNYARVVATWNATHPDQAITIQQAALQSTPAPSGGATTPPPGGVGAGTGTGTTGGTTPSPPPAAPPPPAFGPLGDMPDLPEIAAPDVSKDPWTQTLRQALEAQKERASAQIRRSSASAAAPTGGLNMGGFGGSVAREIGDYNAGLDTKMADTLAGAHESAMGRALQAQLAQRSERTSLALGRMDVMSKKYTAEQQLEGEKYRAQIDQAIAAAQVSAQKEIAAARNETDLKLARISADSAAQVAAMHAQAAAAAAGASASAAQYAADMAYKETILKIAQQKEESQLQYNLGLAGVGQQKYQTDVQNQQFLLNFIKSLGPEEIAKYIFGNQPIPSPVFVQP